ncbi:MAG: porin [Marivivens sp.]|nr:porin [Marivivens sp.]
MKKILLASVALTAFAGAAAAEVSFSGSATLGYNDDAAGDHNGFYSDLNVDVALSATLDNGITVTAAGDLEEIDANEGAAASVTLTIASDNASLVYGDTEFAAVSAWSAVGSMDNDGFSEVDGELVIKGSVTFGDITVSASQEIAEDAATPDFTEVGGLSVGVSASMGAANVVVAYQEEEADAGLLAADELLAIRVGTSLAGADVAFGYADNRTDDAQSTGVSISYPMGAVTVAASYVVEENAAGTAEDNWDISVAYAEGAVAVTANTDESDDWGLEGSYDLGNGLKINAGIDDAGDTNYIAGTYGLGGGASLLVSFVDTDAVNADDEYGAPDYQDGTTVAVSFAF